MVEVEQHEREGLAVAAGAGDLLHQALLEGAVVGQAGQRVGGGEGPQAALDLGVGDREPDEVGEALEAPLVRLGEGAATDEPHREDAAPQPVPARMGAETPQARSSGTSPAETGSARRSAA